MPPVYQGQEGKEARESPSRTYFPLDQLKWGFSLEDTREDQERGVLEGPRVIDGFLSWPP